MEIVIHYPETAGELILFKKRNALIMEEAVINYIKNMGLTRRDRIELINNLINTEK